MDATSGAGATPSRPFSSRSSRSASRFGKQQQNQEKQQQRAVDEQSSHGGEIQKLPDAEDLTVRVRERDTATEERPRSRLGSLFKSASGGIGTDQSATIGASSTGSLEQKASELKETLTRPLSSIFRRSQSHDRQQQQQQGGAGAAQPAAASRLAAMPPPAPTRPTPRGPLTGQSGSSMQARPAFGAADTGGASSSNVANGAAGGTTTATRPFSGFPGKRAPLATGQSQQQRLAATGESSANGNGLAEMDLSEQAAIAPHVNVRRISSITHDPSSLFLKRMGGHQQQQQAQGSARTAREGSARGGIDVNFLSRFLCPEDEIHDEQIPWTWDSLFASVTSELREEWALEEEANNNNNTNDSGMDIGGVGAGAVLPPPQHLPNGPLPQQQQAGAGGQGYVQQKGF